MENQVRFNSRRSDNNLDCLEWYFLIINRDKREISRITTSICSFFAPIFEERKSYSGVLENRMGYQFLNFDSQVNPGSGWRTCIFRRLVKDHDLYRREKDSDGLEKYISEIDKKVKI